MAVYPTILYTACLSYPTGVLSDSDPHCSYISTSVLAAPALARASLVFYNVYGFLPDHLHATQCAILDPGYRMAVLFATAMVGFGYTPDRMEDQATLSPCDNNLFAAVVDWLGPFLTIPGCLLSATPIRDSPGSTQYTQHHTFLCIWGQW